MALSLPLGGNTLEEVVIVGGGIAGLACLNACLDRGISPLLVERGEIGSPKMCGEYLPPDVVCLLEKWELGPIQKLSGILITAKAKSLFIQRNAGAMARSEIEMQLAKRAKQLGGRIVENSNACDIACKTLFLATGKKDRKDYPYIGFPYIGFKAHFSHTHFEPKLIMHCIPGGYFGVVPISESMSNITCLVKKQHAPSFLAGQNREILWKECPVPEFGPNKGNYLPHVYPIGDAIGSLPPASGGGASHSLSSAISSVEYYLKNDPLGYREASKAEFYKKYRMARFLHFIMQRPKLADCVLRNLPPMILNSILHRIGFTDND